MEDALNTRDKPPTPFIPEWRGERFRALQDPAYKPVTLFIYAITFQEALSLVDLFLSDDGLDDFFISHIERIENLTLENGTQVADPQELLSLMEAGADFGCEPNLLLFELVFEIARMSGLKDPISKHLH